MSSLEGPTKAFREFFMMCYQHPKSVTIGIENVTSLQKVTHGNIVSKFTFLSNRTNKIPTYYTLLWPSP